MTRQDSIGLPSPDGSLRPVTLQEPRDWPTHPAPFRTRVAFAAAHVVADPYADNTPGAPATLDWDATLAFRRHLFDYGMGVAEAMDTAQRNMGLDWSATQQLIKRSAAQAQACGARIAAGAGTDQLPPKPQTLDQVTNGYLEQVAVVEDAGAQIIVMASRHLAAVARTAEDYRQVYDTVLSQVADPVILHWLGPAFDPALTGYWGSVDVEVATQTFLELIRDHVDHIDGVKVSLLSAEHEVSLRAALPDGVRLYTGDDFNYPELIEGDGKRHSDALLGAFAAIAPAATAALTALDDGDISTYRAELAPTLALSRLIFAVPTFNYKTGIAFVSWLSGHQSGFTMVSGLQSARSVVHLSEIFELANAARLLPRPELAAHRMGLVLEAAGIIR